MPLLQILWRESLRAWCELRWEASQNLRVANTENLNLPPFGSQIALVNCNQELKLFLPSSLCWLLLNWVVALLPCAEGFWGLLWGLAGDVWLKQVKGCNMGRPFYENTKQEKYCLCGALQSHLISLGIFELVQWLCWLEQDLQVHRKRILNASSSTVSINSLAQPFSKFRKDHMWVTRYKGDVSYS